MQGKPAPFIRTFAEAEPYEQKEPGIAFFNWLLKRDEIPGLAMGRVRLEGPIHKTPGAHDAWEQVYLLFSGSAIIHLEGKAHPVTAPAVVAIPKNTWHSVEVKAGEKLEYAFINQYRI